MEKLRKYVRRSWRRTTSAPMMTYVSRKGGSGIRTKISETRARHERTETESRVVRTANAIFLAWISEIHIRSVLPSKFCHLTIKLCQQFACKIWKRKQDQQSSWTNHLSQKWLSQLVFQWRTRLKWSEATSGLLIILTEQHSSSRNKEK